MGKALRRVVKTRNGVVQSRRRQIRQQLLEAPERPGGLKRLLRRFYGVVGPRIFNEDVRSPVIAALVAVPSAAIARGNQRQSAAAEIGMACAFLADVRRHAFDVLHQGHGSLEYILVNPLQDVADGRAALVEDSTIRSEEHTSE